MRKDWEWDYEDLKFTADSFGAECPYNWEEIVDFLNSKIEEGMNRDDVERIWEDYCAEKYPDAPEEEWKDIKGLAAELYAEGKRFTDDRISFMKEYDLSVKESYKLIKALEDLDTGETEYKKYLEWVKGGKVGDWCLNDQETMLADHFARSLGEKAYKEYYDDSLRAF